MRFLLILLFIPITVYSQAPTDTLFNDVWIHPGKSSAVIFWQHVNIESTCRSYIEYGITTDYEFQTAVTQQDRRSQFHRIKGLETNQEYHFRMVMIDEGNEYRSEDRTFTTKSYNDTVEIGQTNDNSTIILNQSNTTYILTEDINADGIAIKISADNITLELDGHTVNYSQNTNEDYINGILIENPNVKIYNGNVIQGSTGGNYSYAVGARWRADGVEISGLNIDVNRPNAYPIALAGSAKNIIDVHHNNIYSSVTKIESRQYPGNDLIRIDGDEETAVVSVHHNILTEGCHCGISFRGATKSLEIYNNDIKHHQQFVNGYALYGSGLKGAKIFGNRISSIGRTIHLTAPDIEYYNNWASTQGHMTLSDMPQGSGTWLERRVELHGIKFEGNNAKNIKVYDNYMEIKQPLPDAEWDYVPATPLNLACYDPNSMNEIYNNKIIAHTSYSETHHGPYGESGQWASAIYFVGMTNESDEGMYSAYIHDNEFISNDLFISGDIKETHIVRIEDNIFRLGKNPTESYSIFRTIPEIMQNRVMDGNNEFDMDTTTSDYEEYLFSEKCNISPNPAKDYIEIDFDKYNRAAPIATEIKIYDIYGSTVTFYSVKNKSNYRIDVSHLPTGMYFVRVGDEVVRFLKL